MSINKVFLTGNLTREPEQKQTAGGTAILSFGLAVNDRVKNQAGEWTDKANFVDCIMFGSRGAKVAPYIHKGSKVSVSGKLSYSAWDDKQTGQKRSKLEVVIDDIEFMSKSEQGGVQYYTPAPQAAPVPQAPQPQVAPQPVASPAPVPVQTAPVEAPAQGEVYTGDIPF